MKKKGEKEGGSEEQREDNERKSLKKQGGKEGGSEEQGEDNERKSLKKSTKKKSKIGSPDTNVWTALRIHKCIKCMMGIQ